MKVGVVNTIPTTPSYTCTHLSLQRLAIHACIYTYYRDSTCSVAQGYHRMVQSSQRWMEYYQETERTQPNNQVLDRDDYIEAG